MVSKCLPVLAVLDTKKEEVQILDSIPDSISPGQVLLTTECLQAYVLIKHIARLDFWLIQCFSNEPMFCLGHMGS